MRVLAPIEHRTFFQDASGDWVLAAADCLTFTATPGAANDVARFDTHWTTDAVEAKLGVLAIDTKVRVFVLAPEDAAYDVGDAGGATLFEGVVVREPMALGSANGRDAEDVFPVASWTPGLDNRHPDHLVRGRWFYDLDATPGSGAPSIVLEDPGPGVIFNFRGRPNCDSEDRLITAAGAGTVTLDGPCFTGDHDPAGRYWTVRLALRALITKFLYGDDDAAPLTRHVDLEADTAVALMAEALEPDSDPRGRFDGLDAILPETDVTGLGVLDAVETVCRAGGFNLAVVTSAFPDEWGATRPDRVYQLSIAQLGVGRALIALQLPKRGAFPGKASGDLDVADLGFFRGTQDAAPIVNAAYAAAPARIEARFDLRPLWAPGDVDAATIDASLQVPGSTTYHGRHVQGGAEFGDYQHVGRTWGLDCTGELRDALYTTPAEYAMQGDGFYGNDQGGGFDFGAALSPFAEIEAERLAHGVPDSAKTPRFVRRLRTPLPLSDVTHRAIGRAFLLEVSEDAGASWAPVPLEVATLESVFGVRFNGVPNLASTSLQSLIDGSTPAVEASWWALIASGDLRFRLTCEVAADFASRHDAPWRSSSGSVWQRGRYVPVGAVEVWRRNPDGGAYAKGQPFASTALQAPAPAIDAVADAAETVREANERRRVSGTASTWTRDFTRWRVGDAVVGIQGRNIPFLGSASGDALRRYPEIVGMTIRLKGPRVDARSANASAPELDQSIEIAIDDTAFGTTPASRRRTA